MKSGNVEYHVVVEQKGTGCILARYIYTEFERAQECQRDVKEVRVKQNREKVRVRLLSRVLSY